MDEGCPDAVQEGVDYQLEKHKDHQGANRQVAGSEPFTSIQKSPIGVAMARIIVAKIPINTLRVVIIN